MYVFAFLRETVQLLHVYTPFVFLLGIETTLDRMHTTFLQWIIIALHNRLLRRTR